MVRPPIHVRRQSVVTIGVAICLILASATPSPAPESMAVALGPIIKPACDALIPGYAAETAANYAAWRRQNQAEIDMMERNPGFQLEQQQAVAKLPSATQGELRKLEDMCQDLMGAFETAAPADPRFSSPEKTWDLFQTSLKKADRAMAASCLMGRARAKFIQTVDQMTPDEVKAMGDTFVRLDLTSECDDMVCLGAAIPRIGNRFPGVKFFKAGSNWKILKM